MPAWRLDANVLAMDARNGLIVQCDAMNVIRCSRRGEPSRECTAVATGVSWVLAGGPFQGLANVREESGDEHRYSKYKQVIRQLRCIK